MTTTTQIKTRTAATMSPKTRTTSAPRVNLSRERVHFAGMRAQPNPRMRLTGGLVGRR